MHASIQLEPSFFAPTNPPVLILTSLGTSVWYWPGISIMATSRQARPVSAKPQAATPGTLSSSVAALSLLVASQQSKTALAKYKRRSLIERRVLVADELQALKLRLAKSRSSRETTAALSRELGKMAAQLRAGFSQWSTQQGQRVPFTACAIAPQGDVSSAALQASWLIVPPLSELCLWSVSCGRTPDARSALLPPLAPEPHDGAATLQPRTTGITASCMESDLAPMETIEQNQGSIARFSDDRGPPGEHCTTRDAFPAQQWRSARPFDDAASPLANLRAFAFLPQFSASASADVCGAPLSGALVDASALPAGAAGETVVTPPPLSPAVVLCIAEFVLELLQVNLRRRGGGLAMISAFCHLNRVLWGPFSGAARRQWDGF